MRVPCGTIADEIDCMLGGDSASSNSMPRRVRAAVPLLQLRQRRPRRRHLRHLELEQVDAYESLARSLSRREVEEHVRWLTRVPLRELAGSEAATSPSPGHGISIVLRCARCQGGCSTTNRCLHTERVNADQQPMQAVLMFSNTYLADAVFMGLWPDRFDEIRGF